MSQRQIIVDTIIDELKKIKKDDGFNSDAGANVFEWLEKPLENEEIPALVVRDVSSLPNTTNTTCEHTLKIEIDVITDGDLAAQQSREIISDVLKTFKSIQKRLSTKCTFKASDMTVEHKDSIYCGARLEFEVLYCTSVFEH